MSIDRTKIVVVDDSVDEVDGPKKPVKNDSEDDGDDDDDDSKGGGGLIPVSDEESDHSEDDGKKKIYEKEKGTIKNLLAEIGWLSY